VDDPIALEGVGAVDPRRQSEVLQALRAHLPEDCLLAQAEDTRPYETDGLTMFRQLPMLVALPRTEQQVVAILRICRQMQVPVVPRGAGTSLSGGALPHAAGVLLSMARFDRIVSLDPRARIAVVQPGVRNQAISEQAARHRLFYAPDPSSQIACTIGGNVAENSGGVHCLKYGLTLHNVLRVRAVLTDGSVAQFGSEALDSPGLDLLSVLIGSEGMLAVVTEVSVRLLPKPQLARCVMASFDDVEAAGNAVAALIGAGIIPAGLEMMDGPAVAMVEPFAQAGYDLAAAAILLCESDGAPEEVAEEVARMQQVLRGAGATRLSVSKDEAERLKFWAGRKNAFPAAGRVSPDYYCMMARSPGAAWARCSRPSPPWNPSTGCAARTCSTPGTATCIRWCCTTPTTRMPRPVPKPSASRSSNCACGSEARSPASTGSAWKSSTPCAASSTRPPCRRFSRCDGPSIPPRS